MKTHHDIQDKLSILIYSENQIMLKNKEYKNQHFFLYEIKSIFNWKRTSFNWIIQIHEKKSFT